MAREPRLVSNGDSPTLLTSVEKVTYTPGPDDKLETATWGHKFQANVPRDIEIPDESVMAALAKPPAERTKDEVTRIASLSKKLANNAEMIISLRKNRYFHIGPFDPSQHAFKEVVAEPKTAEAYRAWAVHWLKKVESIDDLCQRWSQEARMRARLEVGFDDYHYMSHLFQPKVDDLLRREDDPRAKRDELIRNNDLEGLILQLAGLGHTAAA